MCTLKNFIVKHFNWEFKIIPVKWEITYKFLIVIWWFSMQMKFSDFEWKFQLWAYSIYNRLFIRPKYDCGSPIFEF